MYKLYLTTLPILWKAHTQHTCREILKRSHRPFGQKAVLLLSPLLLTSSHNLFLKLNNKCYLRHFVSKMPNTLLCLVLQFRSILQCHRYLTSSYVSYYVLKLVYKSCSINWPLGRIFQKEIKLQYIGWCYLVQAWSKIAMKQYQDHFDYAMQPKKPLETKEVLHCNWVRKLLLTRVTCFALSFHFCLKEKILTFLIHT